MTQYKQPYSSPKLSQAYKEACLVKPQTGESLNARIALLGKIMDERRESIDTHYQKNGGNSPSPIGGTINLKS